MKNLLHQLLRHRSSAYPWTFLESLIQGARTRATYDTVEKYVMFIGQPRSGTSLIGSLLNAHPDIWIAQELNALRYVARGYAREQLYWLLQMRDHEFDAGGRQWTGYDYTLPGQWQGKCRRLRVIGDKKAGLSTELLRQQPELLGRLEHLVHVPIRIFHLVRNPFNVIATIHRKRHRTSLPLAVTMYFRRCETNWQLMRDPSLAIMTRRLEDLIAAPDAHLTEMCHFLGLDAPPDYLAACRAKLFDTPRQSQTEVQWPDALVQRVLEQMTEYPFLEGYQFLGNVQQRRVA